MMGNASEDIVFEVLSHLDSICTIHFLSTCKKFWSFRNKSNIAERITPYQRYIHERRWNDGLLIAVSKLNIPQILYFIDKEADNMNQAMYEATKIGNMQLVQFFIRRGACRWNHALKYAAYGRHYDLIQLFINNGAGDLNSGLYEAARGGHKDLCEYFIEKGANDMKEGLKGALTGLQTARTETEKSKQKQLIQFFLEKSTVHTWCVALAAKAGDKQLMDSLADQVDPNSTKNMWDEALKGAAAGGHKEIVEYLITKKGAIAFFWGLCAALENGHMEVAEIFLQKNAWHDATVMAAAVRSRRREILDRVIQLGAASWTAGLRAACGIGDKELIQFFVDKEPVQVFDQCLDRVVELGRNDLVDFFLKMQEPKHYQLLHAAAVAGGYPRLAARFEPKVKDFTRSFLDATEQGDLNMVKYLYPKLKSPSWTLDRGIEIAREEHHHDVLHFMNTEKTGNSKATPTFHRLSSNSNK